MIMFEKYEKITIGWWVERLANFLPLVSAQGIEKKNDSFQVPRLRHNFLSSFVDSGWQKKRKDLQLIIITSLDGMVDY